MENIQNHDSLLSGIEAQDSMVQLTNGQNKEPEGRLTFGPSVERPETELARGNESSEEED